VSNQPVPELGAQQEVLLQLRLVQRLPLAGLIRDRGACAGAAMVTAVVVMASARLDTTMNSLRSMRRMMSSMIWRYCTGKVAHCGRQNGRRTGGFDPASD
jgi:hypothetical protein